MTADSDASRRTDQECTPASTSRQECTHPSASTSGQECTHASTSGQEPASGVLQTPETITSQPADRSVSVALNYILALAISTILVTGLIIAGGTFVEDTRMRVVENELTVIGNHLAGNLEQVDRMVEASDGSDTVARINQTFQTQATGSPYRIELENGNPSQVVLNSTELDVSVRVNTTTDTQLDEESLAVGGSVSVRYNDTSDKLEIDNG